MPTDAGLLRFRSSPALFPSWAGFAAEQAAAAQRSERGFCAERPLGTAGLVLQGKTSPAAKRPIPGIGKEKKMRRVFGVENLYSCLSGKPIHCQKTEKI